MHEKQQTTKSNTRLALLRLAVCRFGTVNKREHDFCVHGRSKITNLYVEIATPEGQKGLSAVPFPAYAMLKFSDIFGECTNLRLETSI